MLPGEAEFQKSISLEKLSERIISHLTEKFPKMKFTISLCFENNGNLEIANPSQFLENASMIKPLLVDAYTDLLYKVGPVHGERLFTRFPNFGYFKMVQKVIQESNDDDLVILRDFVASQLTKGDLSLLADKVEENIFERYVVQINIARSTRSNKSDIHNTSSATSIFSASKTLFQNIKNVVDRENNIESDDLDRVVERSLAGLETPEFEVPEPSELLDLYNSIFAGLSTLSDEEKAKTATHSVHDLRRIYPNDIVMSKWGQFTKSVENGFRSTIGSMGLTRTGQFVGYRIAVEFTKESMPIPRKSILKTLFVSLASKSTAIVGNLISKISKWEYSANDLIVDEVLPEVASVIESELLFYTTRIE